MKELFAMEASAFLYLNWKLAKKIYENQFFEMIDPYRKTILRKCAELRTRDVILALGSILKPTSTNHAEPWVLNTDFLLYTAAAAEIILQRKAEEERNAMPIPSKN